MSDFAREVADELWRAVSAAGYSLRDLARLVGRSHNYLGVRFRHEAALTLTDVDAICHVLGLDARAIVAGAPRAIAGRPGDVL